MPEADRVSGIKRRASVIGWALFVVLAGLVLAAILPPQTSTGRPTPVYRKLRRIVEALQQYATAHGRLPYHKGDSRAALFALEPYLSLEEFDLHPYASPVREATWDRSARRLMGADIEYLNPVIGIPEDSSTIIIAEIPAGDGGQFVGCWSGDVQWLSGPARSTSDLLGRPVASVLAETSVAAPAPSHASDLHPTSSTPSVSP